MLAFRVAATVSGSLSGREVRGEQSRSGGLVLPQTSAALDKLYNPPR
jgi:hypothetical protein